MDMQEKILDRLDQVAKDIHKTKIDVAVISTNYSNMIKSNDIGRQRNIESQTALRESIVKLETKIESKLDNKADEHICENRFITNEKQVTTNRRILYGLFTVIVFGGTVAQSDPGQKAINNIITSIVRVLF